MKAQPSLWIVVGLSVLTIGVVYGFSKNPSPSFNQPLPSNSMATTSATPSSSPSSVAANPEESFSPDLRHTDAYEFLDLIPVGKKVPNFSAKTADGKPIHLSDFAGKKNLVLVFYQGSFCSVCGHQLSNLQQNLSYFKAQNAEIIAISADDAIHAQQSVGEHGLTFPVIPDANKSIIKHFGVGNISKNGIAWPSLYVIDQHGIVQLAFANKEGHRMHSNEILPVLSKITGKPAPQLSYE